MTVIRSTSQILLVALDNLGDLVFTSALTPPLHAAFPNATIDVWCKEYTAPVARLMPHVSRIIAADPPWAVPPHLAKPPLLPFVRSIGEVRRARYDIAIVTGAPWRTAAAAAAAGIPVRIGHARKRNEYFLTEVLPHEDHDKPVVGELARLLAPLGIHVGSPIYALDRARVTGVDEIRRALGGRFAALHPFAASRDRCVPLERWFALAEELRARAMPVLWIGMPREIAELRAITRSPADRFDDRCIDEIGDGSLASTAAALSIAALMVGHDSGPMHIAAAFGVPVVGIFAPGQPRRTFPQGVGPWRMIHRPTPGEITTSMMLREIDDLGLSSSE